MKVLQEGVGGAESLCGVRSAKVSTEYITYVSTVSSLCTIWRYVGVEVSLQSLLISVLDGGEFSGSHPGRLTTGRKPTVATVRVGG